MSGKRKSFMVYMDWATNIRKLSEAERSLFLMKLLDFYEEGVVEKVPEEMVRLDILWDSVLPHIERTEIKYQETYDKRVANLSKARKNNSKTNPVSNQNQPGGNNETNPVDTQYQPGGNIDTNQADINEPTKQVSKVKVKDKVKVKENEKVNVKVRDKVKEFDEIFKEIPDSVI